MSMDSFHKVGDLLFPNDESPLAESLNLLNHHLATFPKVSTGNVDIKNKNNSNESQKESSEKLQLFKDAKKIGSKMMILFFILSTLSSACTTPGSNLTGGDSSESPGNVDPADGNENQFEGMGPIGAEPPNLEKLDELLVYAETFNSEIPVYGKVGEYAKGFYLAVRSSPFAFNEIKNKKEKLAQNNFWIAKAHADMIQVEELNTNVSDGITCADSGAAFGLINEEGYLEEAIYAEGGSSRVYLAITNCEGDWSEVKTDVVNPNINFFNGTPKSLTVGSTETSEGFEGGNTAFNPLFVMDETGQLKQSAITSDGRYIVTGDRTQDFNRENLSGYSEVRFNDSEGKLVALSSTTGATFGDTQVSGNVEDPLYVELVDEALSVVEDTIAYTHLKKAYDGATYYGRRPEENIDPEKVARVYQAHQEAPEGFLYCLANPFNPLSNCLGFRETKVFDVQHDYNNITTILAVGNILDSVQRLYLSRNFNSNDIYLGGTTDHSFSNHSFIDASFIQVQSDNEGTGYYLLTDKNNGLWLKSYFVDPSDSDNNIFDENLDSSQLIASKPISITFDNDHNYAYVLEEDSTISVFILKDSNNTVMSVADIKNSKKSIQLNNYLSGKTIDFKAKTSTVYQVEDNKLKLAIGSEGIKGVMYVDINFSDYPLIETEQPDDEVEQEEPQDDDQQNNGGSFNFPKGKTNNQEGLTDGDDYF